MNLGKNIAEIELFLDLFAPKFNFWEARKLGKSPNPVSGHYRDGFRNGIGKTYVLKAGKKDALCEKKVSKEGAKSGRSVSAKRFAGRMTQFSMRMRIFCKPARMLLKFAVTCRWMDAIRMEVATQYSDKENNYIWE